MQGLKNATCLQVAKLFARASLAMRKEMHSEASIIPNKILPLVNKKKGPTNILVSPSFLQ